MANSEACDNSLRKKLLAFWTPYILSHIQGVLSSLTNEIKTILADPFNNVSVDELNNLKHNHVRDILIEVLGD